MKGNCSENCHEFFCLEINFLYHLKFESIGCDSNHRKLEVDVSNLAGPVCYRFSQSNSRQPGASEPQQFIPVLQANSRPTRELNAEDEPDVRV